MFLEIQGTLYCCREVLGRYVNLQSLWTSSKCDKSLKTLCPYVARAWERYPDVARAWNPILEPYPDVGRAWEPYSDVAKA